MKTTQTISESLSNLKIPTFFFFILLKRDLFINSWNFFTYLSMFFSKQSDFSFVKHFNQSIKFHLRTHLTKQSIQVQNEKRKFHQTYFTKLVQRIRFFLSILLLMKINGNYLKFPGKERKM